MTIAEIVFTGSARGAQAAGKEASAAVRGVETSATRADRSLGRLGSQADTQKKKLVGFGNATNLAFGAAGLALGVSHAVKAFQEQEKVTANVSASLKTLGINNAEVKKQIDSVTLAQQRMSGFADEELQKSFATLLRSTGDVNQSLRDNVLVMNIARARGLDLNKVAQVIAKVYDGNTGILKRYGVAVEKGATVQEALAAAQKRYAGQAKAWGDTSAGATAKAGQEFNNLEESIGSKFVPALNRAAGGVIAFTGAVDGLGNAVGGLGPIVVGAAGFGAFKLATPVIEGAGAAFGRFGARVSGAGGGVRGLAAGFGGLVSPMGLAAVGAGVAAAAIYTIWKNSENASQAVAELNKRLSDVAALRQQVAAAKDQVNASKDQVKASNDSEQALRKHAAALHADVVELKADVANLREHGAAASKVETATNKVTAKTKEWKKALDDIVPATHVSEAADHQLAAAKRNVVIASDALTAAQGRVAGKIQDVINKANAAGVSVKNTGGRWSAFTEVSHSAARGAAALAGEFEHASKSAKGTDSATSKADATIAKVIRTIGRVPTTKEFKLITNLAIVGRQADSIVSKLGAIHDKSVTVKFNQTFGARVNPLTGLKQPAATGGMVSGRFGDGDRVPAMLSGEEAVLNPEQQALVDGGMTVMGALRATGAPVIGFAGGGMPHVGGARRKRKKKARGIFRPEALLDTSTSQVFDDRGPRPMRFVTFEDGSQAWIEDKHPGGVLSYGELWEQYVTGQVPGYATGGAPGTFGSYATGAVPAARVNVRRWKKELAKDTAAKDRLEKWLYANSDGSARGTSKKPNPKHALWQGHYDQLHAPGRGVLDQVSRDTKELSAANRALAAAIKSRATKVTQSNAIPNTTQFGADVDALNARLAEDAYANTDPLGNLSTAERADLNDLVARYSLRIATLKKLLPGSNKTRRDAINQELVTDYDALKSYRDQLNAPANADSGSVDDTGAAGGPGDTGGPADTGPTADQQAVTAQLQQRLDLATRSAALGEAEISALTGSGDIGTGRFANALGAGSGVPAVLQVLGDQRSLATLANAFVQGAGSQPAVSATRQMIAI